jgi:hypothetical protein
LVHVLQWALVVARVVKEVFLRKVSVASHTNVWCTFTLVTWVQATLALTCHRGGLNLNIIFEGIGTVSDTLVEPKILEVPVLQLTATCAEVF